MMPARSVDGAVRRGDQSKRPSRTGWTSVPLTVRTDAAHGGRWTSLSAGGREWLWRNPDTEVVAARERVLPGAAFVDAGGVEECLPTVNGLPDHGAVWSRPWDSRNGEDAVVAGDLSLTRAMTRDDGAVSARYVIGGPPGTPFVHAVHALLDVGPQAELVVSDPQLAVVLDESGAAGAPGSWPPTVAGTSADRLGPADGTAVAILLPGCHDVVVIDGADALELRWRVEGVGVDDPCSLLVWRNLGGWPTASPYRSIGIEPMVGRTIVVAGSPAGPGPQRDAPAGAVRMPPTARFRWAVRLRAWRDPHAS